MGYIYIYQVIVHVILWFLRWIYALTFYMMLRDSYGDMYVDFGVSNNLLRNNILSGTD